MKKLFLEIFIFLAVFFSAYFFIFHEGSTTGDRATFLAVFGLIFLFYFSYTDAKRALNSWFASDTEVEGVKEKLKNHSELIDQLITSICKISSSVEEISGPGKKRAEQINTKLDTLSLGHEEICERFREFEKRLNIQTETSENFMQLLENYSDRIRNLESEINLIQEQIKPIKK